MLCLCSNDSSVLCRSVTPRRCARGPCGLTFARRPVALAATGISEVSPFSCMKLGGNSHCRSRPCCLPRITRTLASGLHLFGAQYPPHLYLCLSFTGSLAVAAQDSRPSGSLVLSREASSSSASWRFSPAHCNG